MMEIKKVNCELLDRTGEINHNTYGSIMTIIKYKNNKDIIVQFENGYKTKVCYSDFKKGLVKNPYDKTVYNIGYLGEGKYKTRENSKHTIQNKYWMNMLNRCYCKEYKIKQPTYKNVICCNEWHNFQNFGKWFDENYYTINNERMALDKDILYKGNKIYSPNTCIFVPQRINSLFVKNNKDRGKYPIGVSYNKSRNKYFVQCSDKKKSNFLGRYETVEEAFNTYKHFKEQYIKQVADEYKDKIPKKLYDAMYNWKVEIND